jgi:ferric-dicitrate binding protein FerR (iron transport regulator)
MSHPADHLIAAWLIDDLDAKGIAELEATLRADPTARARFARFCQSESVLTQALPLAPMRPASTSARRAVRGSRMRLRRPQGRLAWVLSAAAAALVAVIVMVTVFSRPTAVSPAVPAPVVANHGPLELLRADGQVQVSGKPLAIGLTVPRGALVEVFGGNAELRWRDGSQLIATNGTSLRVTDDSVAVRLLTGHLDAHVAKQSTLPFSIGSAHATVSVMGTQFSVVVSGKNTELSVREGRVAFTSAAKTTTQEVIAGESAVADEDGLKSLTNLHVHGFVPTGRDITRVLGERMIGRGTLHLNDLPRDGINLRIECTPEVHAVRTGMRGIDNRLEQVPAFHVFGDVDNRATKAWKPRLGTFIIDAQPCGDVNGRQPLGPAVVFELTIVP